MAGDWGWGRGREEQEGGRGKRGKGEGVCVCATSAIGRNALDRMNCTPRFESSQHAVYVGRAEPVLWVATDTRFAQSECHAYAPLNYI